MSEPDTAGVASEVWCVNPECPEYHVRCSNGDQFPFPLPCGVCWQQTEPTDEATYTQAATV